MCESKKAIFGQSRRGSLQATIENRFLMFGQFVLKSLFLVIQPTDMDNIFDKNEYNIIRKA